MRPSPRGLYHTQVCCTQSSCPCDRSLSTCTSTRDTPAQFCLSLCGVPGSWCTQDLFEPAECLWQELGLILKVNLPLIPSFWGFSFALGCGVSPHSCFSTVQSPLQCLPSCWDFSDLGHGVSPHGQSSEAQPPLLTLDVASAGSKYLSLVFLLYSLQYFCLFVELYVENTQLKFLCVICS